MQNKMSHNVLNKIKNNGIKMKPKWLFLLRNEMQRGILALLLLASSLMLSAVVYFIELIHPEELIEYGEIGWEVLIEEFPYLILGGSIALMVGSVVVFANVGDNYKKTTTKILRLVSGSILIATLALTIFRLVIRSKVLL